MTGLHAGKLEVSNPKPWPVQKNRLKSGAVDCLDMSGCVSGCSTNIPSFTDAADSSNNFFSGSESVFS
jgi:hypothetical protein